MIDTAYEKPEDETELAKHIASALDQYVGGFARTCMMGIKRQDLGHLASSEKFPDLVKRLDKNRVLSLEVKIRSSFKSEGLTKHRFKSFDRQQRKIYEALYHCKVPIFYCYNAGDRFHETLTDPEILRANKASEPKLVCDDDGLVALYDKHLTLFEIIKRLREGEIGTTGGAAGAIFPFIAGDDTSRLGIRRLLLAYNLEDRKFDIYDDLYLRTIIKRTANKSLPIFMDLGERSFEDIVGTFQTYTSKFNEMIARPRNRRTVRRSPGMEI